MRKPWFRLPGSRAVGALLMPLILGCASIATRVPPVTPELAAAAAVRGIDPAALSRGRELYLARCTRCHGPVAVAGRTPRQWQAVLPAMTAKSRLTEGETADLTAYIGTVGDLSARR
jgi:mono/diheme cytochrome c family protein